MAQAYMRGMSVEQDARASAPLITLFERDDAIAVPLLSHLRMVGYDVRSARTPVELFDILGKNVVALVLVDLGAATAGRREFWVALDAQRRGRSAMQVLTFRYTLPANDFDLEFEPSARAIADVEIHGAHEFGRLLEAVRQRAPLHGPAPAAAVSYAPDGAIQPLGAALGMPLTPYGAQVEAAYGAYGQYGGYAPPSMPGQPAGYGAGYDPGYGMGTYQSVPPGGWAPQSYPASPPSMPQPGPGAMGFGGPLPPQFSARMETTPMPPNAGPFGQPGFPQGFPPSFPPMAASPFAFPTSANPFGAGAESSPFAQPLSSNPFAQDMQEMSAPSAPPAVGRGFERGFEQTPPRSPLPGDFSGPSSWGAVSGGYLADAPGFAGWQTPNGSSTSDASFPSDPGAQPARNGPIFQDAWNPPDAESDMETSALPEDAFAPAQSRRSPLETPASGPEGLAGAAGFGGHDGLDSHQGYQSYEPAQPRPWEEPRVSSGGLGGAPAPQPTSDPFAESYAESTAAVSIPTTTRETQALMRPPTPTETALGSVLVEGALLTPNKLETLRGIQAMLASVNMPRKLGELAVMFKFLSSDQLLAALLVSRGLVSPQQIASLGRVKQEMAATGLNNDLETLLVRFNVLPADQLRTLRQELAS